MSGESEAGVYLLVVVADCCWLLQKGGLLMQSVIERMTERGGDGSKRG